LPNEYARSNLWTRRPAMRSERLRRSEFNL
jgi:hypothetical protein